MNKKQTINLIISIIVIGLVVGALLYKKPLKEALTPNTNEPNAALENPDLNEGEPTENGTSAVDNEENMAKFNATMDQARIAFRNKDYPQAIVHYKQASLYNNVDTPYSGLFIVYGAQGDWVNAQKALDSAIKLNPSFADYWISKLSILDEKTNTSYQNMKKIYEEGVLKVDPQTTVNLVTSFARIAESNNQKAEAIKIWQKAIEIAPENKAIYQAEIDRLK